MEFLTEISATLHHGRNLDVITSAEIVRSRWNDIVVPAAFATASLIAEHIDLFCEVDLALPDVYTLLRGAADAIASSADPVSIVPRFQLRLLDALGLAPPGDSCIRCGSSIDGCIGWIDVDAGGIACERCSRGRGDASALDAADVANFAALAAPRRGARPAALMATPRTADAVDRLVTHHLGRRPRARAVVDALPSGR